MAVFIDSNVFLYAAGHSEEFKGPCLYVLRMVAEGRLDAYTSTEVLQEILHVVQRKHGPRKASEVVGSVLALFPLVFSIERKDIEAACEILHQNTSLSSRGAMHLASMRGNGIETILSLDCDFDGVPGVRRVDPRTGAEIMKLLRPGPC